MHSRIEDPAAFAEYVRGQFKGLLEDPVTLADAEYRIFSDIATKQRHELAKAYVVMQKAVELLHHHRQLIGAKKLIGICVSQLDIIKPRLTGSGRVLQNSFDRVISIITKSGLEHYLRPKDQTKNRRNSKYSDSDKLLIINLALYLYDKEHCPPWSTVYRQLLNIQLPNNLELPPKKTFSRWIRETDLLITERHRIGAKAHTRRYNISAKYRIDNYGDCWQIDATRSAKPYWDDLTKNFASVTFFIIIDTKSQAILGVGVGDTEDHTAAIKALRVAVKRTGHLPRCLVGDKGPGYNNEVWLNLASRLRELGCPFLQVRPNAPELKAHVESAFSRLEQFIHRIPGHVGRSITSKRIESRLSPEAKLRSQKANARWTRNEVMHAIGLEIEHYNNVSLDSSKSSPITQYSNSEKPNIRPLSIEQQAFLFWFEYKRTITHNTRGEIKIEYKKMEYRFMIDEVDVRMKEFGRNIIVRVDVDPSNPSNDDWDTCYIFSEDNQLLSIGSRIDDIAYLETDRTEHEKAQLTKIIEANRKVLSEVKQTYADRQQFLRKNLGIEDLESEFSNDKMLQNEQRDRFNISPVFMEEHGIKHSDQRHGKIAKERDIESAGPLERITVTKTPTSEATVPVRRRLSRFDYDDLDDDLNKALK